MSDRPGDSRNMQSNGERIRFEGYLTDRLGDAAVDFIGANAGNPFFLYFSPNAVHTPMQATEEDLKHFEGHPRQYLAAMTLSIDRVIGRIADALKATGVYEDTLIFFLSDNGGAPTNDSSNYPLKGYKGMGYEGGHRVPFFVVWKNRLPAGKRYEGLCSSLDITATILTHTGIRPVKLLDGVDLVPFMETGKGDAHQALFWRKEGMCAVRRGGYKLVKARDLAAVYDLRKDPSEMNDLAGKGKLAQELLSELRQWERQMAAPLWLERSGWNDVVYDQHRELMLNERFAAEVNVQPPYAPRKR